jgi:protein TonB
MFDNISVRAQSQRLKASPAALGTAMAIHLAMGVTAVGFATWSLRPLPEPPERVVFARFVAPALPAPERPGPVARPEARPATQRAPETQPREVVADSPSDRSADESPESLLGAATQSASGGTAGAPEGIPEAGSAATGGAPETWERVSVGMDPPRVLRRVEPAYPEPARRAHRQGTVVLELHIDRSGSVARVEVLRRLGFGLDEAAARAAAQWRFSPARRNGVALPVIYTVTVNYRLS